MNKTCELVRALASGIDILVRTRNAMLTAKGVVDSIAAALIANQTASADMKQIIALVADWKSSEALELAKEVQAAIAVEQPSPEENAALESLVSTLDALTQLRNLYMTVKDAVEDVGDALLKGQTTRPNAVWLILDLVENACVSDALGTCKGP